MKPFIKTILYVKTHNVTGLKYFGKTTKDPFKYKGSGIHWSRHLKIHGNDVSTVIVGVFNNKEECTIAAKKFSQENNIVESSLWANMIEENGLDGGFIPRVYGKVSKETREKISKSNKGKKPWNVGKTGVTPGNTSKRSKETKLKISTSLMGKKQPHEVIEKRAASNRGKKRSSEFCEKMSEIKRGKPLSEQHKENMRGKKRSEETRQKIKEARAKQIFTEDTKKKLSGFVICIDRSGNILRIPKEIYHAQTGKIEEWDYIFHRHKLAQMRRG
jgi:hypothetical protein